VSTAVRDIELRVLHVPNQRRNLGIGTSSDVGGGEMGAPAAGVVLQAELAADPGAVSVHALILVGPPGNRFVTMCTGETASELPATFDPLGDSACPACRAFMIHHPE
jgi:hypothetical protein